MNHGMAHEVKQMQTNTETSVSSNAVPDRARVVLIESNTLTVWAIKRTLSSAYDLVCCSTLDAARAELAKSTVASVICGSPVMDDHPEALAEIAQVKGRKVLALVSDIDRDVPATVRVLEKPFDLARLSEILADGKPPPSGQAPPLMETLTDRLHARIRAEVCPVCIHRTADCGCSLQHGLQWSECPAFKWAEQLAELVKGVESDRLGDYLDRIQAIICPACKQSPDGRCKAREQLDCPIDLYLGLVIPIVEEELKRVKLVET
jgi:hypothetical protein